MCMKAVLSQTTYCYNKKQSILWCTYKWYNMTIPKSLNLAWTMKSLNIWRPLATPICDVTQLLKKKCHMVLNSVTDAKLATLTPIWRQWRQFGDDDASLAPWMPIWRRWRHLTPTDAIRRRLTPFDAIWRHPSPKVGKWRRLLFPSVTASTYFDGFSWNLGTTILG